MIGECELCDKPANNRIDGHELCADHIIERNQKLLKASNAGVVTKPQTAGKATNARQLATRLNCVLEDLLCGDIEPDTAFAACKVSTELIKLFELTWRMEGR